MGTPHARGPVPSVVIDETGLDAFRARLLAPPFLLDEVQREKLVLVSVPLGGGKSAAADRIIAWPDTYKHYDLVVYTAPSWDIVNERALLGSCEDQAIPYLRLEPRPHGRCGTLDNEWRKLETKGCAAYGKATLCARCPHAGGANPCSWPTRFGGERIKQAKVIFCTEQHLALNPYFLTLLKRMTGAKRVLHLHDEARVLDGSFKETITADELQRFEAAVAAAEGLPTDLRATWLASLTMLRGAQASVRDDDWEFPAELANHGQAVQAAGIARSGMRFRNLTFALIAFPWSRRMERHKDPFGNLSFTLRPYLAGEPNAESCTHTLILSANLKANYVAKRLGLERVAAPFEGLRIRHSGTRIFNVKNRIGMARYFPKNSPQILDFFASLIARNIDEGRTTLLVSRLKFKRLAAEGLRERLEGLGHAVTLVTEGYNTLGAANSHVVPIIHYGMAGVNSFNSYEAVYCLNGYYIADRTLNENLQGDEPEEAQIPVSIHLGADGNRTATVQDPRHRYTGLSEGGDVSLRKLEVDPVLQAVGRARFFTHPREVIFFQLNDLAPDVGEVVEFRTLAEARQAFGVAPGNRWKRRKGLFPLLDEMDKGFSMREAAARLGINRQTACRWLKGAVTTSLQVHLSLREAVTQGAPRGACE